MKKILFFWLAVVLAFSVSGQNIVGGGGVCKTNADPDLITNMRTQSQYYECSLAWDTVGNKLYVYRQADPVGDRWDEVSAQAITALPVIGNGTAGSPITLGQQGATTGQALTWNGTSWAPATVSVTDGDKGDIVVSGSGATWLLDASGVTAGTYGSGSAIPVITVDAKGRITNVTMVSGSFPPTGTASGDLAGTYPGPTVDGLQGQPVSATVPTANQVLKWNGSAWEPAADANTTYTGGTGINVTGTVITNTGDLSNTNELQTLSVGLNTATLSNGGGSVTIAGGGINTVSTAGSTITVTGTEVDGSTTNEIELPSQTGNAGRFLTTNGTSPSWGVIPTGTVTSVGLSLPAQFSVSGSPVTTSGTLTASWANQNANLIFASPASGGAGVPGFRSLVAADLVGTGAVTGSGIANQIAYFSGANTIVGNGSFTYNPTTSRVSLSSTPATGGIYSLNVNGNASFTSSLGTLSGVGTNYNSLKNEVTSTLNTSTSSDIKGGTNNVQVIQDPGNTTYNYVTAFNNGVTVYNDVYYATSLRSDLYSYGSATQGAIYYGQYNRIDNASTTTADRSFANYRVDMNKTSSSSDAMDNAEGFAFSIGTYDVTKRWKNASGGLYNVSGFSQNGYSGQFYNFIGATQNSPGANVWGMQLQSRNDNSSINVNVLRGLSVYNDGKYSGYSRGLDVVLNSTQTTNTPTYGLIMQGTAFIASNSNHYALYIDAVAKSYIRGRLGIGKTAPTAKVDIQGEGATSASYSLIVTNSSGNTATAPLAVRDDGQVGVGTNVPARILHVAGNMRLTGSAGTPTLLLGRDANGDISNIATGASTGQVLQWNGTTWVPATLSLTDTHFANTDLSLTASRTHTFGSFGMVFNAAGASPGTSTPFRIQGRTDGSNATQFLTAQNASATALFAGTITSSVTTLEALSTNMMRIGAGARYTGFSTEGTLELYNHSTDPVTISDGEYWYNSALERLKYRGSATQTVATVEFDLQGQGALVTSSGYTIIPNVMTIQADANANSITLTAGDGLREGYDYVVKAVRNGTNAITISAQAGYILRVDGSSGLSNTTFTIPAHAVVTLRKIPGTSTIIVDQ